MLLKISARKSDLARLQAYFVGEALQRIRNADSEQGAIQVEYFFRESLGDKNLNDPLWKMPEKGVFTEDFYRDLIDQKTDMVVHSWKDLPTEGKPDTVIAATLPRADQRDVLLFKKSSWGKSKIRIYSSSPRRAYNLSGFLSQALPWKVEDLSFESVRGNIPTRLKKTKESDVDGIIVAKAALDRLLQTTQEEFLQCRETIQSAMQEMHWMVLPLTVNPNAAAQGAIAIEVKRSRQDIIEILQNINCAKTFAAVQKERDFLSSFGGGCHQKIGVAVVPVVKNSSDTTWAQFEKGLTDSGRVLDSVSIKHSVAVPKFPSTQLMSLSSEELQKFVTRSAVNTTAIALEKNETDLRSAFQQAIQNKAVPVFYVSKTEGLPSAWIKLIQENQSCLSPSSYQGQGTEAGKQVMPLLLAPGVRTWIQLAQMGLWVSACSDHLGENFNQNLEALTKASYSCDRMEWHRLTHSQSAALSVRDSEPAMKNWETYEVQFDAKSWLKEKETEWSLSESQDKSESKSGSLKQFEFFYWRSASQFEAVRQVYPDIIHALHACGPGHSYDFIAMKVGPKKVFQFMSEQDWREQCTLR